MSWLAQLWWSSTNGYQGSDCGFDGSYVVPGTTVDPSLSDAAVARFEETNTPAKTSAKTATRTAMKRTLVRWVACVVEAMLNGGLQDQYKTSQNRNGGDHDARVQLFLKRNQGQYLHGCDTLIFLTLFSMI